MKARPDRAEIKLRDFTTSKGKGEKE
jgi:hypothetical protein